MRKKDSRLRIYIFYVLLLAPTVIWAILSLFGVAQKLDTNTGEKRNKHEIAEGTTLANLTEELELVYNDNVPFRSVLLNMNSALNYSIEIPYLNAIMPGLTALANAVIGPKEQTGMAEQAEQKAVITPEPAAVEETPVEEVPAQTDLTPYYETPNDAGYYPLVELAPEVIQGRDGWLFTSEDVPDYEGGTLQSDESLANIAGNMQTLNEICKEKGIELHYIAFPNKANAYTEYMPSLEKAEYTALQQLEDYINSGYDFSFSFISDEVLAAKKYGRLYYMTDTHWNGLGAMACVVFLHQKLGLEPIDQGSLEIINGDQMIGDLIDYTGLPKDSFPADYHADYAYKMDVLPEHIQGDDDIMDEFVTPNASDGRTVVYVGDSYRHHIMQYLNKDFAHTYFINEKVDLTPYADIIRSADILLVGNVERNFYVNPDGLNVVTDLIGIIP